MFYIFLAVALVILGIFATSVARLVRASPEKRLELLWPKKRAVLVGVGAIVATSIVCGVVFFSFVGVTGIRAVFAAKDYLRGQYGEQAALEIKLSGHVERSKHPEAGVYQIHYHYGKKEGNLTAEYFERDGKLVFKITPKEK